MFYRADFENLLQRFDFKAITHEIETSEQHETIRQTVQEVEHRLAVMLGVPVPTAAVCMYYALLACAHTHEQIRTNIYTCNIYTHTSDNVMQLGICV